MMGKRNRRTKKPEQKTATPALLTLRDHIRELQGRLFVVVLAFVLIGAASFPFFDRIAGLIVAPLGAGQQLVYLTPGGAFSFILQVCMYVGFVGALPVIIYELYRFIAPAIQKVPMRRALWFTMWSFILAVAGIVFAYKVSLPAALYFLTGFNLYHINPMLTVDSYFSFVMTYLLAGALLFQLPLVMLIINSVKPLKPGRLMRYQDRIILGSFIVAAIITPTPDALNQTLLACPIVVMYQVGILLVWFKNRHRAIRHVDEEGSPKLAVTNSVQAAKLAPVQMSAPVARRATPLTSPITRLPAQRPPRARSVDGFVGPVITRSAVPSRVIIPNREPVRISRPMVSRRMSVDGFVAYM